MATEVILALALFCAAGFFAVARGGPPERLAAVIIVCWILADVAVHLVFDGGELVAIVWLALRANRRWPLWAAAAQLICFSGHMAVLISPEGMRRAYWAMTQLPPYIQLTSLLLGAVWHARRFERIGPYRSWRYT